MLLKNETGVSEEIPLYVLQGLCEERSPTLETVCKLGEWRAIYICVCVCVCMCMYGSSYICKESSGGVTIS